MSAAVFTNGHQDASTITNNAPKNNDSSQGWVVQKFGGTSVGKFAVNIAEDIVRLADLNSATKQTNTYYMVFFYSASLKEHRIAVVCSARSTGKKVEGTTSR